MSLKTLLLAASLFSSVQLSAAESIKSCNNGDGELVEVDRFHRFGQETVLRDLVIRNADVIEYLIEAGAVSDYYADKDSLGITVYQAFDNGEYAGAVAIQSQVSYSHVFIKPQGNTMTVEFWKAFSSNPIAGNHRGEKIADWTFTQCN